MEELRLRKVKACIHSVKLSTVITSLQTPYGKKRVLSSSALRFFYEHWCFLQVPHFSLSVHRNASHILHCACWEKLQSPTTPKQDEFTSSWIPLVLKVPFYPPRRGVFSVKCTEMIKRDTMVWHTCRLEESRHERYRPAVCLSVRYSVATVHCVKTPSSFHMLTQESTINQLLWEDDFHCTKKLQTTRKTRNWKLYGNSFWRESTV